MKTMKITRRLMGFAAVLMALTACSESEDMLSAFHSDPNAVRITAEVGKASADGFTRSNPLGDATKQTEFNENDEISVKAYILTHMKFVKYYGKTILVFELESLNKPICYNNTFYERENNETIKVEGADSIMALLARFN